MPEPAAPSTDNDRLVKELQKTTDEYRSHCFRSSPRRRSASPAMAMPSRRIAAKPTIAPLAARRRRHD